MQHRSLIARQSRRAWPAGKAFALVGGAFGCTFLALLFWLAVDQHLVLEGSQRLLDHAVPATLERFRLARNVEQLRLEGEHVFSGRTPVARQQALFIVSLLASHPAVLADARAAGLAGEVERFLGRSMHEGMSEARHAEWAMLASRLTLLADDVSSEGVNLATADLHQMSATMLQSRSKLLLVLVLVAVFVGGFVFLIHRHLIQPLQAIDQALSALGSGQAVTPFAPASMLEIRAVERAIGQLREVMQENETTREQLERLATTDGLTGMFNRRHFLAVAEEEIKRAQRYSRPICVGMADLDFFKHINDSHGHASGDLVLQSVAEIFARTLRHSDWGCRFGGEEFAFVFPETGLREAHRLAERLRQSAAASPIALADGSRVDITLSLGLAEASSCPLEIALQRADAALYDAKQQGRNRVVTAPVGHATGETARQPFNGDAPPSVDTAPT